MLLLIQIQAILHILSRILLNLGNKNLLTLVLRQVQVKAINADSWQFDIRKFLNVVLERGEQKVLGINEDLDKSIICVFVALGDIIGKDEFYIFRWGWLQKYFLDTYIGRKPPKNIKSFHCAIWKKEMYKHLDKWHIIKRKFKV